MPERDLCGKFCVVGKKRQSTFIQIIFHFVIPPVTSVFASLLHEHTNVIPCFTEHWYCPLLLTVSSTALDWVSSFYCWHFSVSCWLSIVLSLPHPPLLISRGQISFPFLISIYKTKISHSIITSNCGFSPSSSFKSRKRDMEDLQSSMGRQYGHPSCLSRRQNVVLTNPQMYLVFFFSPANPFHFLLLFLFLYENAASWLAERSLPASLWTACVPWACPRRRSLLFSFFFSSACLSLH